MSKPKTILGPINKRKVFWAKNILELFEKLGPFTYLIKYNFGPQKTDIKPYESIFFGTHTKVF